MKKESVLLTTDLQEYQKLSDNLMRSIYPVEKIPLCDSSLPENMLVSIFTLSDQMITGRIVLYPNNTNTNKASIFAGNYECINNSFTASRLLSEASEYASKEGYNSLTGPVNESTWNNYRFMRDLKEPLFFTEKYHHGYYPDQWQENGFEETAEYFSALQNNLSYDNEKIIHMQSQFTGEGITIRNIDLTRLDSELKKIYPLCNRAFADNLFFSDITEARFVLKYTSAKDFIDPSLVYIAERNGRVCGFIFCLPNYTDKKQKGIIIKTLVRDPEIPRCKGLGTLLSLLITREAAKRGFDYLIHAFMHTEKNSAILSERFDGTVIRRYSLFEKKCG